MTSVTEPPPTDQHTGRFRLSKAGRFFAGYAWLILKNLIGWTLIPAIPLASFVAERFGRPRLFIFGAFAVMTVAMAILPFAQGLDDRIDAIANNAKDMSSAPIDQGFNQNIGCVQIVARHRGRLGRECFVGFRRCGREMFGRSERCEAGDRCSLENVAPQKS